MSVTTRRYTYQDLLETPDDGKRYEIIDGELFVTASPARLHVWLMSMLVRWLDGYVEANDLGKVFFAPLDVKFSEDNVVVPDIVFIKTERVAIFNVANVGSPPDIVIEVLSPSTRRVDLTKKFDLYARMGVPEYWIADPLRTHLTINVLDASGVYKAAEPRGGRLHSTVLADLEIDLAKIFEGLPSSDPE